MSKELTKNSEKVSRYDIYNIPEFRFIKISSLETDTNRYVSCLGTSRWETLDAFFFLIK